MSMEACPAESTKRSRLLHSGFAGLWRRCRVQSRYPTGASPMGAPGCPELAFCTASIESTRTASTARRESAGSGSG